jgi:hypothetical protein
MGCKIRLGCGSNRALSILVRRHPSGCEMSAGAAQQLRTTSTA